MSNTPTDDEMTAIVAALAVASAETAPPPDRVSPLSAWTLGMRRSDLEFDDLLALRSACSIRF